MRITREKNSFRITRPLKIIFSSFSLLDGSKTTLHIEDKINYNDENLSCSFERKKNDRKLLVSPSSSSSFSDIKLPMLEFMCRYEDMRMIYASFKILFFYLYLAEKIKWNYFNLDHGLIIIIICF